MLEIISYILNAILTSGIIVSLVTLKSTRKKAQSQADSLELDNAQKLLDNFDTYIAHPLLTEVCELRKSINRLQSAIKQIPSCPHSDTCPVTKKLDELKNQEHNTIETPN